MSGTVNISRDIFEHGVFKDEPLTEREAWMWMVMQARWKPATYRAGDFVVNLDRGQFAASIRFMAKAWDWSAPKVQRFVERLKKMEMICVKTDTGVSVVTVCNYAKFQATQQEADTGPIQDRYRTDTEKKKDVIREEGKEEEVRGASAPKLPDPKLEIQAIIGAWAGPEAVRSFMAYRAKSKGKALTLTAAKRLAANLKAIFDRGGDANDALGMAEERGWLTVETDWYFNSKGKTMSKPSQGHDFWTGPKLN
jgi:hypothetical protein